MTAIYYDYPSTEIPAVQLATLEAIRYWICSALYPDELYAVSQTRFKRATFESGIEHAIRKSVRDSSLISGKFPFTAYNIGDSVYMADKSTIYHTNGNYYSTLYGTQVRSIPIEWNIPMMTLFTEPSDYYHGETILHALNGKLQRMEIPITINGSLDSFYADVTLEIAKGSLAFDEIEQETRGEIYDIIHNLTINMQYFIFSDADIYPVDDIEVALSNLPDAGYLHSTINYETLTGPPIPTISTVVPADEATGISIDADVTSVIITFSTPMDEVSVEAALDYNPVLSGDLNWNSTSTVLTIDLVEDLVADTEYTVEISSNAKSVYQQYLEEDVEWTFTTA